MFDFANKGILRPNEITCWHYLYIVPKMDMNYMYKNHPILQDFLPYIGKT